MKSARHFRNAGAEAGFTLAEALVGLVLMSLLSLMLLQGLQVGAKAWGRAAGQSEVVDRANAARIVLRSLLENVVPFYNADDPTQAFVDFYGDPAAMRFLTTGTLASGSGERLRIALTVSSNGRQLLLGSVSELARSDNAERAGLERELVAGAAAIRFSYYGKIGRTDAPAWHERWARQAGLPLLIRVQVGFEQHDARRWTDLDVAARRMVDVGCVYDALSRYCRGR